MERQDLHACMDRCRLAFHLCGNQFEQSNAKLQFLLVNNLHRRHLLSVHRFLVYVPLCIGDFVYYPRRVWRGCRGRYRFSFDGSLNSECILMHAVLLFAYCSVQRLVDLPSRPLLYNASHKILGIVVHAPARDFHGSKAFPDGWEGFASVSIR